MSSRMMRLADQYRRELRENDYRPAELRAATFVGEVPTRYDEACGITPAMIRAVKRFERAKRAEGDWFNWYVNRGHLPLAPTKKQLRAVSWRRVF